MGSIKVKHPALFLGIEKIHGFLHLLGSISYYQLVVPLYIRLDQSLAKYTIIHIGYLKVLVFYPYIMVIFPKYHKL